MIFAFVHGGPNISLLPPCGDLQPGQRAAPGVDQVVVISSCNPVGIVTVAHINRSESLRRLPGILILALDDGIRGRAYVKKVRPDYMGYDTKE